MKNFIIFIFLLNFVSVNASINLSVSLYGLKQNGSLEDLPPNTDLKDIDKKNIFGSNVEGIIQKLTEPYVLEEKQKILLQEENYISNYIRSLLQKYYKEIDYVVLIQNYLINPKKHNIDFLKKHGLIPEQVINWEQKGVTKLTDSVSNNVLPVKIIFLKFNIVQDIIKPLVVEDINNKQIKFLNNLETVIELNQENRLNNNKIKEKLNPLTLNKNKKKGFFFCFFLAAMGIAVGVLLKKGIIEVKINTGS